MLEDPMMGRSSFKICDALCVCVWHLVKYLLYVSLLGTSELSLETLRNDMDLDSKLETLAEQRGSILSTKFSGVQ